MLISLTSALILAVSQASAGDAARAAEADRLTACLERIETEPEEAYEDGLAWFGEGGRPFARQCTALALIALGHVAEGAARLEELANADDAGSLGQRVIYLAQSGNAWLLAGAPEEALVTLDNALKLSPGDAQVKADRASALMALERWEEAAEELDEAVAQIPRDGFVRKLRGEVRLVLGDYEGADADVQAAIAADPEDIEAYVLRGRVNEARRVREEDPAFEEIIRTGDEG